MKYYDCYDIIVQMWDGQRPGQEYSNTLFQDYWPTDEEIHNVVCNMEKHLGKEMMSVRIKQVSEETA